MSVTTVGAFPIRIGPLSNITPFTYRNGITYQELLENLVRYIDGTMRGEFSAEVERVIEELNTAIGNAENTVIETREEWDRVYALFLADIEARVMTINNRIGPEGIKRFTLTGDTVLNIDPVWPNAHAIRFQYTQDAVGGHSLTLGAGISGTVELDPTPGALTEFELVPEVSTWRVEVGMTETEIIGYVTDNAEAPLEPGTVTDYYRGDKAWAPLTKAAVGLNNVNNTADANKPISTDQQAALDKKVSVVRTREELETALLNGGVIHVDGTIAADTPLIISQPGTEIYNGTYTVSGNGSIVYLIQANKVLIDGITVVGPGTTGAYKDGMRFIAAGGAPAAPYDDITIRNCVMRGSLGTNIHLRWCTNVKVHHNTITDFLYAGVMLLSVNGFSVHHNEIHDAVMKTPVVNVYGVAATDSENTIAARSKNGSIDHNNVSNIPWEGIDTHGGEKITINANTVNNCLHGIALVVGNAERNIVPNGITVTGNYIDGNGSTGIGISLYGKSGLSSDGVITGNDIKGYTSGQSIFATLYNRNITLIGGNSVPFVDWTNIDMAASTWTPHPTRPPQYRVDGRTVTFRGMVVPPSGGVKTALIGTLPPAYAPIGTDIVYGPNIKGADAAAGTFTLGIRGDGAGDANGQLSALYGTGTDSNSYPLTGTYSY